MRVNELFASLQGEATDAGWPTAFVRLTGCNLRCLYCDTRYAYEEGTEMTVDEIVGRLAAYKLNRVCVTGGEPFVQETELRDLLARLVAAGHAVVLETNGSYPVTGLPDGVAAVIDVKTPGSGMSGVMNFENLRAARRHVDEFKFVITGESDFDWMLDLVSKHRLDTRYVVHVSPAFDLIDPLWLAERILKSGRDLHLSLQLHKILWPKDARGK